MQQWLQRELMIAFREKDVKYIVELNRQWYLILKQQRIALQQGERFSKGE